MFTYDSVLEQTPAGDIPIRSVTLASDGSCLIAGNNKVWLARSFGHLLLKNPTGQMLRVENQRRKLTASSIPSCYEVSGAFEVPHEMSSQSRCEVRTLVARWLRPSHGLLLVGSLPPVRRILRSRFGRSLPTTTSNLKKFYRATSDGFGTALSVPTPRILCLVSSLLILEHRGASY